MYSSLSKKHGGLSFGKTEKYLVCIVVVAPYAPIQYDVLGIYKKQRHGYYRPYNHNPLITGVKIYEFAHTREYVYTEH